MKLARLVFAVIAVSLAGCATKSYDYTNYRQHPPRSIVVLPPLNESTDVAGTYGYLSTVTYPLAEQGYYVFPVAEVDQFLKENGLPSAGEMHQAPVSKFGEILGADAVLYITLEQYGTKYQVINSATAVKAKAKLVDTRTASVLWEGEAIAQQNSGGSGNILGDLIAAALTQAINKSTDAAHNVARATNAQLFLTKGHGLLYGPYHPKYGTASN
jgi:hypothetical protein